MDSHLNEAEGGSQNAFEESLPSKTLQNQDIFDTLHPFLTSQAVIYLAITSTQMNVVVWKSIKTMKFIYNPQDPDASRTRFLRCLQRSPQIKSLTLFRSGNDISCKLEPSYFAPLTNLTKLLIDVFDDSCLLAVASLPRLKELFLNNKGHFTPDAFSPFSSSLETLTLAGISPHGVYPFTDPKAIFGALGGFTKLKDLTIGEREHLFVEASDLEDDQMEVIASLTNLQTLCFIECSKLSQDGLAKLTTLTSLKKLTVHPNDELEPRWEPTLSTLTSLTCLQVSTMGHPSEMVGFTNLTELLVTDVSDYDLQLLSDSLTKLRVLSLQSLPATDYLCLQQLTNLEELTLNGVYEGHNIEQSIQVFPTTLRCIQWCPFPEAGGPFHISHLTNLTDLSFRTSAPGMKCDLDESECPFEISNPQITNWWLQIK